MKTRWKRDTECCWFCVFIKYPSAWGSDNDYKQNTNCILVLELSPCREVCGEELWVETPFAIFSMPV